MKSPMRVAQEEASFGSLLHTLKKQCRFAKLFLRDVHETISNGDEFHGQANVIHFLYLFAAQRCDKSAVIAHGCHQRKGFETTKGLAHRALTDIKARRNVI